MRHFLVGAATGFCLCITRATLFYSSISIIVAADNSCNADKTVGDNPNKNNNCPSVPQSSSNNDYKMTLPPTAYVTLKNKLVLCRVTTGLWQLSGAHNHRITQQNLNAAVTDLVNLIEAGFTSVDLADHYGAAEDVVGELQASHPEVARKAVFMTKWVPQPGPMTDAIVLKALDVSRRRMKMPTLDLVQFHWWEYSDPRYINLVESAQNLVGQNVLRGVALTNFDSARVVQLATKADIVSNQVSFSIVDLRPLNQMLKVCQERNIVLISYGVLLGGLLTDRFLNKPEPSAAQLNTASLKKYMGFVRQWGSWTLFQELLNVLDAIAKKHNVSIANVAVRWVIEHDGVVALIGARIGLQVHIEENLKVFSFQLDSEDLSKIAQVQRKARMLPGDCGDEYR